MIPARDLALAADREAEVDRIEGDDVKVGQHIALLERGRMQQQAFGDRHRPCAVKAIASIVSFLVCL
mgnify:CR=1 FL=1